VSSTSGAFVKYTRHTQVLDQLGVQGVLILEVPAGTPAAAAAAAASCGWHAICPPSTFLLFEQLQRLGFVAPSCHPPLPPPPPQFLEQLGVQGVLILEAPAGTPAAAAGLRPTFRDVCGDIVLGDIIVGECLL
jgi:S1-C subfamily serine protease